MNKHHTVTTKRNRAALTLVDMIALAAVIFLITWGLFPMFVCPSGPILEAVDKSNLRQISISYVAYARDHEDMGPVHPRDVVEHFEIDHGRVRNLYLNPYQDDDEVIDRGDGDGVAVRYGGYVFVNLGLNLEEAENLDELILAYTAKTTPGQLVRNVAFADGHVESWGEDQLRLSLPEGIDVDALDGP